MAHFLPSFLPSERRVNGSGNLEQLFDIRLSSHFNTPASRMRSDTGYLRLQTNQGCWLNGRGEFLSFKREWSVPCPWKPECAYLSKAAWQGP